MSLDHISDVDAERIADILLRKLERKFLRLPDKWHRIVMKNMVITPIKIPVAIDKEIMETHHELYLEGYIHSEGGLTLRVKDAWGEQIWERTFS